MFSFFRRYFTTPIGLVLGALILIFLVYLLVNFILARFKIDAEPAAPCTEGSPQLICYNIPENVCVKSWLSYEKLCLQEISEAQGGIRPSELIGSKVLRCQKRMLEKTFHYSRQNASAQICLDYFNSK